MRTAVVITMLALMGCHKVIVVRDGLRDIDRIDLPRSLTYVGNEMSITDGVFEVKLIFKGKNNE